MKNRIKLLLVDDHLMFLEGLQSLFNKEPSIEVIGTASSAAIALKILTEQKADVVITDLSMPAMDGSQLIERLHDLYPETCILVLSMHSEADIITKLIQQNVNGYLLKNAEKSELLKAVQTIFEGKNYFSAEVQKIFTEHSFKRNINREQMPELSSREKEVLKLIVDEFTTKEIAQKLFISQHTVESHRKNIISKLNVKNVAGLVKYAIENNLV